jgi:hypothetical protein
MSHDSNTTRKIKKINHLRDGKSNVFILGVNPLLTLLHLIDSNKNEIQQLHEHKEYSLFKHKQKLSTGTKIDNRE